MAFIETQPVAQASGAVRELYEHQEAYWGFVPNYAKAFSHRPEVLVRWGKLLAELRRPVSDDRFELVTLVAALELRNSACALAHGRVLAELTDKATVLALAEGREAEVLSLMAEGLNNAGQLQTDLTVILNDNKMSISPNVGAVAKHLTRITSGRHYNRVEADVWDLLGKLPKGGKGPFGGKR